MRPVLSGLENELKRRNFHLHHTNPSLHNNKLPGVYNGPIFVSGLKDKFSFFIFI